MALPPPEYNKALAQIRNTFPDASDFDEELEVHKEEFEKHEMALNIDDENILVRAITTPYEDDGSGMHFGKTFFHWALYDFTPGYKHVRHFHYYPPKPIEEMTQEELAAQKPWNKEFTYPDWLRVKYFMNPDVRVLSPAAAKGPDFYIPDHLDIANSILKLAHYIYHKREYMPKVDLYCQKYINKRFEDYLEDYKESNLNKMYLVRADFFRKLKSHHLTFDHKMLIAGCYIKRYDCHFIEGELRENYAVEIECL